MLTEGPCFVIASPSPPRGEQVPVEDEDDFVYVPFVDGQLDCTGCHSVRAVLHKIGGRKLHFIVHSVDQGTFQHAIFHFMSIDANSQFQTDQLVYVDFHNHTLESVQDFIQSTVEGLRNVCSNISAALPNNDSHVEIDINMLGNIPMPTPDEIGDGPAHGSSSQPVMNEEQNSNAPEASSQEFSLPVTQEEETNVTESKFIKPINLLGFTPNILESSHVKPYDPESNTSVLLYPSMLEKMCEKQQARVSNLTMEDASKMFEEIKEEAATEPDLSSTPFKRLCRNDNTYRKHARRIKDLNGKIKNLVEQPAQSVSSSGLFYIKQKFLMYKQEKEDSFSIIELGLQEFEQDNDSDAAGPSGSH